MRSPSFARRSGTAAVLAGVTFVVSDLLDLVTEPVAGSDGFGAYDVGADPGLLLVVQSGLTLLAGVLLLFGLLGLYAYRFEEVGLLGLFGVAAAFSGTVMAIGGFLGKALVAPSLAHALTVEASSLVDVAPPRSLSAGFTLSYGLVAAGWLAFALSALRVEVYPRATVALIMVGAFLTWFPLPLAGVVFGLAVMRLGYVVYSAGLTPPRPGGRSSLREDP